MKTQNFTAILMICFLTFFCSAKANVQIIDHADSVVLDMSQAIVNGNSIDIPIRILSDDTIYALDFSFKFNHLNLVFDSVINTTLYITSFYYYNPADSVLRFTSNSLHEYAIDSPVVYVRFTILNTVFLESDIYEMLSYLNGDTCSTKYTPYLLLGVGEVERRLDLVCYPNPASGYVRVAGSENSRLILCDINGNKIGNYFMQEQYIEIDISQLKAGIYILRLLNKSSEESRCKLFVL